MNIFAFAGSSSSTSINKKLVEFVLTTYFKEADINLIDLRDYEMPLFSVDKEKKGYPEAAHQFLKNVADCDLIICSLAEHNRSYSAAFKNIFDWCSRIEVNVFQNKPILLLSTSPGGYGGGNVMSEALKFFPQFGADIKAHFSLPKFQENFKDGITNSELLKDLEKQIEQTKQYFS